jgi:hypothetical protein
MYVLMIKFDKFEKTGPSDFLFQTIQFSQFQNKNSVIVLRLDLRVGVLTDAKNNDT